MSATARLLIVLATLALMVRPAPAAAQLAAPNSMGVSMGHVHLVVRDLDATRRFLVALSGVPMKNGTLEIVQFPGTYVNLRQGEPMGGSVGTTVNHFGFLVKKMDDWLPKWKAAGLKIEPQTRPTQAFLIGPDEFRVEILEDQTIDVPLKMHHVHFFVSDPLALQAFYVKTFGAVAGKRGQFDAADLPGVNLTFSKADTPTVGTMGRSIDHIGFEIKNLEAFTKRLQASGIKLDREYQKSAAAPTLMLAYITDPAGTYVELTEGLTPKGGTQ
jgi:catechol 2,3-dioxygenase-like lactoylglutathione lyase family enzyme